MKNIIVVLGLFCSMVGFAKCLLEQPKTYEGLELTSTGIREKKILFASVDVYQIGLYGKHDGFPKALMLTLLRNVDAAKIKESFQESLGKNDVKVEGALTEFFAMFRDLKKGTVAAFVATNADTLELILPEGKKKWTEPGLSEKFMKIWFGIPADGKMEELKQKLISSNLGC